MSRLPWGFTEEATEKINSAVRRHCLDGVISFVEMLEELSPLFKELHIQIYRRAESYFDGDSYRADELAGKIILDLYDENSRIWTMTRKLEGRFWFAVSRKFKDYYYEMLTGRSGIGGERKVYLDDGARKAEDGVEEIGLNVDPEEHAVLRELARQGVATLKEAFTPAELRIYLRVTALRYCGYSTKEIAEDLGLMESTVTSWYSRLKKRAQEELAWS